ncbi:MAG TPA: S8 family serine peptidase [Xanthomonadales bacterium]|nr:S8 family serine peptidase [Xanthomonadales bacterium]
MQKPLIGIIDTGINPWHSHVRGEVRGCRIFLNGDGKICEDSDFSDKLGHGTAVAGVLRKALPDAVLFAVRVFESELTTYPSLVARGILRAAAEGCDVINLSLALPPGAGAGLIADACAVAHRAGSILVAAGHPQRPGLLPASLPGVNGVVCDDELADDEIEMQGGGPYPCRARGLPRELDNIPAQANLWGHSLACARVAAYLARAGQKS